MKKDTKGITLIALVITIIVLLILATVSIAMLTGENGLLKKAIGAKEKNKVGEEKEIIQLAYSTLKIDEIHNSQKITKDNLKTEIEKSNYQIDSANSDINGNNTGTDDYAKITFKDTTNWYIVNLKSGKIEEYGVNGEIIKDEINVGNIEIYDIEDLQKFQSLVNEGNTYKDCTVRLMSDIDLSSICGESIGNWEPIGNFYKNNDLCFEGTFEGNNHTISNIYINNSNLEYQGFFGSVKNGSISDLNVSGTINAKTINGGIIATIRDSGKYDVTNCENSVDVTNVGGGSGGIVGHIRDNALDTKITESINRGTISTIGSEWTAGGIIGAIRDESTCVISKCTNEGIVKCENIVAGGIVGRITANVGNVSIIDCNNKEEVIAERRVGGIIGSIDDNTNSAPTISIQNCKNNGNITAKVYNAGGMIGYILNSKLLNIYECRNTGIIIAKDSNAGGIIGGVGTQSKCVINKSANNGNITAEKSTGSAGIIGKMENAGAEAEVNNSYNAGVITVGTANYGGIIGFTTNNTSAKISCCHNVGILSGSKTNKGAMVGYQNGTYTGSNNYWLETCNASYSVGSDSTIGNKYTTDKMKVQSNFNGWDFTSTWQMDTEKGYPVLQQ